MRTIASYPSYDEVNKVRVLLRDTSFNHWIHDDLFTWRWWLLLALAIIPWIIWWKIVDKRRIDEIFRYGLLIGILAISLDDIGTELLWWGYPDKLFQMVPPLIPADLTLIPVYTMTVYQLFNRNLRQFLIANVIFGAFAAFVIENVLIWLNLHDRYTWKGIYSWLFYVLTALICRWIVIKTRKQEAND